MIEASGDGNTLGDAISLLRKRPEMYLGLPEPTADLLASYVLQDAMTLGIEDLRVRTLPEGWTVLSAGKDWTRIGVGSELPRVELFRRLFPVQQIAINEARGERYVREVRHEAYLVAYCRDVFVRDTTGIEALAGQAPSEQLLARLDPALFHMGFRI